MLPPENLLAVVNRKSVPTGQEAVTVQVWVDLLCSAGARMKKVCLQGRQAREVSSLDLRRKPAGMPREKTGEFMLSPELPDFSKKEEWPAKIECTAGEKGLLPGDTVNVPM